MTSSGNNFNDFHENQLTKIRAVYYTLVAIFSMVSWSIQPGECGLWTEIMLSVRHFYI